MRSAPPFFLATLVLSAAGVTAAGPPYDFRPFEAMVPAWQKLFRIGPGIGEFSAEPSKDKGVDFYGTTDQVYVLDGLGLLPELNNSAAWAEVINSFQNSTTGYINLDGQYSGGLQPYHAISAAAETLALLGQTLRYPATALEELALDESQWVPFMEKYFSHNSDVWSGGHAIQSPPGVLHTTQPDKWYPFFDFWFKWLLDNVDKKSGYWDGAGFNGTVTAPLLGGAFHCYKTFECFAHPWYLPEKIVDSTLGLQVKSGPWAGRWLHSPTSHIDIDGTFSSCRASRQAGMYRWDDVRAACELLVGAAHSDLTSEQNVMHGVYASTSHNILGAIYAVAECSHWWPELSITTRPWKHHSPHTCSYS